MSLDDLLERAQREIDEGLLPACQLAIAKDGELVAFESFGEATNDTRFHLLSATKTFVCSCVWILLGEGALRLDQPVGELIDGFAASGKDGVTLEHVLTHSAGFPTAYLDPMIWDDVNARRATFARWRLDWEPGTAFEYHGVSGHWLLADLIELVTGTDFRDFLRARVVEPLGLETFWLGRPPSADGPVLDLVVVGEPATPDELDATWGIREVPESNHRLLVSLNDPGVRNIGIPAGGGISTAVDVVMFYQALLRNTHDLWDENVLRDATGNVRNRHPDLGGRHLAQNYALGVRVATDDGLGVERGLANRPRVFGHDGAGGQLAFADPDTGLSFCYLTNGLDENLVRQWRRIAGISHRAVACLD